MKKLPYVKTPCKDCPYRKDSLKGWLGEKRATEFIQAGSFLCHKNTKLQCAGHMILRNDNNSFVKMAKIFGEKLDISGHEFVFSNEADFIKHHQQDHTSTTN